MPPVASASGSQWAPGVLPITLSDSEAQVLSDDGTNSDPGDFDLSTLTDYLDDKITALLPDSIDLHGVDPTVLLSVLLLCVFIVLGACINRCSCVNLALRWCRLHASSPTPQAWLI